MGVVVDIGRKFLAFRVPGLLKIKSPEKVHGVHGLRSQTISI
jgi:hypothetical protein